MSSFVLLQERGSNICRVAGTSFCGLDQHHILCQCTPGKRSQKCSVQRVCMRHTHLRHTVIRHMHIRHIRHTVIRHMHIRDAHRAFIK